MGALKIIPFWVNCNSIINIVMCHLSSNLPKESLIEYFLAIHAHTDHGQLPFRKAFQVPVNGYSLIVMGNECLSPPFLQDSKNVNIYDISTICGYMSTP